MDSDSKSNKKTNDVSERGRQTLVEDLLKKMETKLGSADAKATVGDFIRLVQLSQELNDGEPREIKVTWVEPEETDSTGTETLETETEEAGTNPEK